jgi:serine/threonine-protein kinase
MAVRPKAGSTFEGYRLEEPLHSGDPGKLWLGRRERDRRSLVIRFLSPAMIVGGATVDPRRVDSSVVASVLARGSSARTGPYVVHALGRGETLESLLEREGAPAHAFAAEITRAIGIGVSDLHGAGMKHGDVRPDNVYLFASKHGVEARLLDAGIRTTVHERDLCARVELRGVLTPVAPYLSPERVRGKPLTRQADLWALSVMAYEMLTGDLPFIGGDLEDLLAAIEARRFRRPSDIDDRLGAKVDAVFDRAFQREPAERHQSARQLADQLIDALGLDDGALDDARRAYVPPAAPPSLRPERGAGDTPPPRVDGDRASERPVLDQSIPMRPGVLRPVLTHALDAGIAVAATLVWLERRQDEAKDEALEPAAAPTAGAAQPCPPASSGPGPAGTTAAGAARLQPWPDGVRSSIAPDDAEDTAAHRKDYGF